MINKPIFKDYILTDEIYQKAGFAPSNISIMIQNMCEGLDYVKYGHTVLLNRNASNIPEYIKTEIQNTTYTDLSETVPFDYFVWVLENKLTLIGDKYKKIKIGNKYFVEFLDEELKDVMLNERMTKSVVKKSEMLGFIEEEMILDYIELTEYKYLVWY